jgi:hypothetical protein
MTLAELIFAIRKTAGVHYVRLWRLQGLDRLYIHFREHETANVYFDLRCAVLFGQPHRLEDMPAMEKVRGLCAEYREERDDAQ